MCVDINTAEIICLLNFQRSLAEAEEVAKTAAASNNELEYMNSVLMEKVKMLHETVKKLERQLCEDQKTRVKLFKVSEKSLTLISTFLL